MRKDIQEQIDKLVNTLPNSNSITDKVNRFVTYLKKEDNQCLIQHRIFFIKTATKRISKPSFKVVYKTQWELHPDSLKELEEI